MELLRLTKAAQERNRAESITGLVLYDDSWFFQWLEGPAESLSRVMQSISNDTRHTDIEVLTREQTEQRTFADWDMKLALPAAVPASWTREVIRPSSITIETLRRRPEIAAAVMERLSPRRAGKAAVGVSASLEEVVRTRVIPELVARHRAPGADRPALEHGALEDGRASGLADLLLAGDIDAVLDLLRPEQGPRSPLPLLCDSLFGVTARHLGDRWLRDECSEFDVTLGLCMLQTVVLRIEQDSPVVNLAYATTGTALVLPQPGETHGLNAAMAASGLRSAGWCVQCSFPSSDAALEDLLANDWFDVLDLSLSAAFRREDRLAAVAATIALGRSTSRNPALRITVGGRIFTEQDGLAAQLGADTPNNGPVSRRN